MIRRIDHVAIAVRDLERAKGLFVGTLGGRVLYSAPLEHEKFRWTTIELGTSCFVELIDPLERDGFLHRFLETRGEGVHHITFHVDDAARMKETLEAHGVPTFGHRENLPGWREVFVHPRHAFGTLLQFAEFDPLDWIDPGHVPPSYAEFAPPRSLAGAGIEVRRTGGEEPGVEVRQGDAVVRVPLGCVGKLAKALSAIRGNDPSDR